MAVEGKNDRNALKGVLLDIERDIQTAWEYLGQAQQATYIEETAERIRDERHSLNTFLNHLAKAQTVADDVHFLEALAEIKPQAALLRKVSDQIKQIDPGTAGEVVGYMETAVTLIAQAVVTMARLP